MVSDCAKRIYWPIKIITAFSLGILSWCLASAQYPVLVEIDKGFYNPCFSAKVNEIVLFSAWDKATNVCQLWRTDGTPNGTVKIRDFPEGIYNIHAAGNRAFLYVGNKYTPYPEALWVSDGTSEGTRLVTAQRFGKYTYYWSSVGTKLLFVGDDGIHGDEMWVSDGTASGTMMLFEYYPGVQGSSYDFGPELNGRRFLYPRENLSGKNGAWTTDGTPGGTVRIGINTGWFIMKNFAYQNGSNALWESDGTPEGTQPLPKISAGRAVGTQSGDMFYIIESVGKTVSVSDGTPSGTRLVKKLDCYSITSPESASIGNKVLFEVHDLPGDGNASLWITDGTDAGTFSLISGGDFIGLLKSTGGKVFFTIMNHDNFLWETWVTDGTAGGTHRITSVYWVTYDTDIKPIFSLFMDSIGTRVPLLSAAGPNRNSLVVYDTSQTWNAARHWRLFE